LLLFDENGVIAISSKGKKYRGDVDGRTSTFFSLFKMVEMVSFSHAFLRRNEIPESLRSGLVTVDVFRSHDDAPDNNDWILTCLSY